MQTIPVPATSRERAAQRVHDFVLAALPGKELIVTVAEKKRRRSDEQNRYWWGVVVKTYCDHLDGWDPDDVHTYLCGEHFGWQRIEGLGRSRVKPIRRSSRLSKAEFAELVDFAQRKAAEHGFYVPDPNE
jgi:hypothetical protein